MPANKKRSNKGPLNWSKNRSKDPEARKAYNAYMVEYRNRPEVRERMVQYLRKWNGSPEGRIRKKVYQLNKYGVTLDEYNLTLVKQGGVCAICKSTDAGRGRDWHTDHCHKTGKFRGLLCCSCNLGLGYFKDNPVFMSEAIKYITNH
jgi:hypothetical protein